LVPLDSQPVAQSSRLLLAATAWCGNSGMQWGEDRRTLLDWGHGPVLIEPVAGAVTLRGLDEMRSVQARVLTAAGAPTDTILPVCRDGGDATITLGHPAATMILIEVGD
jgi:hypothetical protein